MSTALSRKPGPTAIERQVRYWHLSPEQLKDEWRFRERQVTEILTDLQRDPTSWSSPDSSLNYVLTAFEDVDARLQKLRSLHLRAQDPEWHRRNEERYQDLLTLAADLKQMWPLPEFLERMLLVPVARRGNRWVAQCVLPDHQDKTPSFVIGPSPDLWRCFGCLRGGDLLTLVGMLHGLDTFTEQVLYLADAAGLSMKEAS